MSSRPSRGAARLAAILDALPDALLLVNCNGTVVNANSIALEVFESPGTALVGRGLLDLLPDFDSKLIPGSMRRPDDVPQPRTKPKRMVARRTDGSQFVVEVTSANLDGRTPYESSFEAAFADHGGNGYTGDELLMLVVRDLTGTVDTEAELARQQRQTEMILRAAAEGVIGVDTEGRIVLVNPAAAQILGHRASDLGGQKLHPLVHHSRPDGSPLPYEETPLADTLRSGRKHRVRGRQVLWTKNGRAVPVNMTTAPVRDGDQLVGAVLAFTDRTAYDELAARHRQLLSLLESGLRGPLEQLRGELGGLAADPAGQLWPEANQILHYLAAGYTRMTTLLDNVLSYQRLDSGGERLRRETVPLEEVVSAGVEGAVELIGPGRAQFAVHAPPVDVEVDPVRLAQALAHLVADVAGVDATGNAVQGAATGDSTIVVAAAQRGDVVRIEVRGPYGGGSPVHEPLVRGIVRQHGGVLQTHRVPGAGGESYVLEVPVGSPDPEVAERRRAAQRPEAPPPAADPAQQSARDVPYAQQTGETETGVGGGRTGGGAIALPAGSGGTAPASVPVPARPQQSPAPFPVSAGTDGGGGAPPVPAGTGRRRARRALAPVEERTDTAGAEGGAESDAHSGAHAMPQPSSSSTPGPAPVPAPSPNGTGVPAFPQQAGPGGGRRARRAAEPEVAPERTAFALPPAAPAPAPEPAQQQAQQPQQPQARTGLQTRTPPPFPVPGGSGGSGVPEAPAPESDRPTGRRRRVPPAQETPAEAAPRPPAPQAPQAAPPVPEPQPQAQSQPQPSPGEAGTPAQAPGPGPEPGQTAEHGQAEDPEQSSRPDLTVVAASPILGGAVPPTAAPRHRALPMPGSETSSEHTSGVSVRTLGQGVPFGRQGNEQHSGQYPVPQSGQQSGQYPVPQEPQAPQQQPAAGQQPAAPAAGTAPGRRRKLAAPPEEGERAAAAAAAAAGAVPGTQPQAPSRQPSVSQSPQSPQPPQPPHPPAAPHAPAPGSADGGGREFAIGAPEAGAAEGPEPLDGPGGAVEVTPAAGPPVPMPADDELPPEPLDNPRRLLVWPEPDVSTQQALTDRGYRPVIVHSREEVDAQIAAYPAALFVDPLTGPITRTALQSLRQAAVAAEVPVLVTAGLGQASREAAYGADPAVLLKALAPRDSEQHPPRVLLVEEHAEIAEAFAATLERRGMHTAHAPTDADAVQVAEQIRPNLVVMDLMQVRRRRAGIIDWLRVNGLLNRTPFVVYTSTGIDPDELFRLASGETVLFLAERSTTPEVQSRIVDLLAKIGAGAG
ncbi:PAS domain-containing protein [Streptomyces sp. TRM 70361]|uniref:PAS domain-containing protein n=1 Tax=Streptomyces sp. TRM 70361 TaxID=3116553 RepID=UPI002E7B6FBD|nr:PAS domain-containing protein [Streptomyces sp. TRM 70361]MEE1939655.1 PAS domain-containing protein [Streptomyces sp. TRM 70361]